MSLVLLNELRKHIRNERSGMCRCNLKPLDNPLYLNVCNDCIICVTDECNVRGMFSDTTRMCVTLKDHVVREGVYARRRIFAWQAYFNNDRQGITLASLSGTGIYDAPGALTPNTLIEAIWGEPSGATSRILETLVQLDTDVAAKRKAVQDVVLRFAKDVNAREIERIYYSTRSKVKL